jgi:PLP dependent protein
MTDASTRRFQILDRIAKAAARAGRSADEVRLVAISKTRTTEEIEALIAAGQREFGESRVQEAETKWASLRAARPDIRLHMIGRLQSNKATEAVALFDTIHSLDRLSLLEALSQAASKAGRFPACYVQVNIGEEAQKGGVPIGELDGLIDKVRVSPLPLAGLMCIPPAGLEPAPFFAFLNELGRRHDVTGLSMGMSADFEEAVMLGATAVRVGSALFE